MTDNADSHFENYDSDILTQAAYETANPIKTVEVALSRHDADAGALYEPEVLEALSVIRTRDKPGYQRLKKRMKGMGVALGELEKAIPRDDCDGGDASTPDLLLQIAEDSCEFFHDKGQKGYAIIPVGNHHEVWPVASEGFKRWLKSQYFKSHHKAVFDQAMNAAIGSIEAVCIHEAPEADVHMRCAKVDDAYYLDLCNSAWQVVKITAAGWEVINKSPINFIRNQQMRELPTPQPGGKLDNLWSYANVPALDDRLLLITWMLECFRPETPFPILEIVGEQGSAKSSTQQVLRDLIDPNKVPLRGAPKMVEDIYVAAYNNWLVSYENLSSLTADQQDALCTLSTGGGFATRQLYSNGEESVLESKRPVVMNGINVVATRPDLIERTVHIETPSIAAKDRRTASEILAEWERDKPEILGGLLDLLCKSLQVIGTVKLQEKERMADYQVLGEAVAQGLGNHPGEFSQILAKTKLGGIERSLEAYGVAQAIDELFATSPVGGASSGKKSIYPTAWVHEGNVLKWRGTVQDLHAQLASISMVNGTRSNWPRSAKGLSDQLRRLTPSFRAIGIHIEFGTVRTNKGRMLTLSREFKKTE